MSTDDKKPPTEQSDDDGWSDAAAELDPAEASAPAPEPEPADEPDPPEPAVVVAAVDDDWAMSAPPAKPSDAPRDLAEADATAPASTSVTAASPSLDDDDDGDEPEIDYAEQARRWREDLHAAVGIAGAEQAVDKRAAREAKKAAATGAKAGPDAAHKAPPKPRPLGGGSGGGRLSSRAARIALAAGVLVATIGFIIGLGWFNSRDYYFVCGTESITAERGNGFPPWGASTLSGDLWKPIEVPRGIECQERKTDDPAQLEAWYLEALLEQAKRRLASAQPDNIDLAQAQLEQALLFTRKPERADTRGEIKRLLGDVEYWRAASSIKQAVGTLEAASARFAEAAKKLPRFQSDSAAWAEYARSVSAELVRGPPELRPADDTPVQPGDQPNFTGTGPDSPIRPADAGPPDPTRPDAQPGMMLPPPTDAAPPPPDAGLPRGGVLL